MTTTFPATAEAEESTPLTRPLLVTMAAACGLGIANLYYNQPLLAQMAKSLHVSVKEIGTLPMLTQAGFALGVFLLAPLGDVLERRRLVLTMLTLVTISLVAAVVAPSLGFLQAASFVVGITSVISTLVLPFAVSLGRPGERGAIVGSVSSAMLIGVLLSRTVSGSIGQAFGWRVMYAVAAGLMVALALALRALLPKSRPATSMSYRELIRSTVELPFRSTVLRQATANGMLLYGALSAFWATLVFLVESPAYRYGPAVAGMFGVVGAGGAMFAPVVGKLADRHSPRVLVGVATLLMLASFGLLALFGLHLWGLILGVVALDLAAQAATISNQATVYSLPTEIHSRAYTVYRACYSLGGAVGAYLGVYGWTVAGWTGVCAVGMSLIFLALLLHLVAQKRAILQA